MGEMETRAHIKESKFQRFQVLQSMFSDTSEIKLELSNRPLENLQICGN